MDSSVSVVVVLVVVVVRIDLGFGIAAGLARRLGRPEAYNPATGLGCRLDVAKAPKAG